MKKKLSEQTKKKRKGYEREVERRSMLRKLKHSPISSPIIEAYIKDGIKRDICTKYKKEK